MRGTEKERAERDGEKIKKKGKGERGREKERDTCTLSKLREGEKCSHHWCHRESALCWPRLLGRRFLTDRRKIRSGRQPGQRSRVPGS